MESFWNISRIDIGEVKKQLIFEAVWKQAVSFYAKISRNGERKIYETIHPETKHTMRNWQTSKDCSLQSLDVKPFVLDAAEKLGVSDMGGI